MPVIRDPNHHCPNCKYEYTLQLHDEHEKARCPRCGLAYSVNKTEEGILHTSVSEVEMAALRERKAEAKKIVQSYRRLGIIRPCPICGEDNFRLSFRGFTHAQCSKCNYSFLLMVPFFWIYYFLAIVILFFGVAAGIGTIGLAVGIALGIFAILDQDYLITPMMKNSFAKALRRKLGRKARDRC